MGVPAPERSRLSRRRPGRGAAHRLDRAHGDGGGAVFRRAGGDLDPGFERVDSQLGARPDPDQRAQPCDRARLVQSSARAGAQHVGLEREPVLVFATPRHAAFEARALGGGALADLDAGAVEPRRRESETRSRDPALGLAAAARSPEPRRLSAGQRDRAPGGEPAHGGRGEPLGQRGPEDHPRDLEQRAFRGRRADASAAGGGAV